MNLSIHNKKFFWAFFGQLHGLHLPILIASLECIFKLCLEYEHLLIVLLRIERGQVLEPCKALLRVRHGIVHLVPPLVDCDHLVADLGDLHKSGISIILGQALEEIDQGLRSMAVGAEQAFAHLLLDVLQHTVDFGRKERHLKERMKEQKVGVNCFSQIEAFNFFRNVRKAVYKFCSKVQNIIHVNW